LAKTIGADRDCRLVPPLCPLRCEPALASWYRRSPPALWTQSTARLLRRFPEKVRPLRPPLQGRPGSQRHPRWLRRARARGVPSPRPRLALALARIACHAGRSRTSPRSSIKLPVYWRSTGRACVRNRSAMRWGCPRRSCLGLSRRGWRPAGSPSRDRGGPPPTRCEPRRRRRRRTRNARLRVRRRPLLRRRPGSLHPPRRAMRLARSRMAGPRRAPTQFRKRQDRRARQPLGGRRCPVLIGAALDAPRRVGRLFLEDSSAACR